MLVVGVVVVVVVVVVLVVVICMGSTVLYLAQNCPDHLEIQISGIWVTEDHYNDEIREKRTVTPSISRPYWRALKRLAGSSCIIHTTSLRLQVISGFLQWSRPWLDYQEERLGYSCPRIVQITKGPLYLVAPDVMMDETCNHCSQPISQLLYLKLVPVVCHPWFRPYVQSLILLEVCCMTQH